MVSLKKMLIATTCGVYCGRTRSFEIKESLIWLEAIAKILK
jgi:hypothetical protein